MNAIINYIKNSSAAWIYLILAILINKWSWHSNHTLNFKQSMYCTYLSFFYYVFFLILFIIRLSFFALMIPTEMSHYFLSFNLFFIYKFITKYNASAKSIPGIIGILFFK